jgi:hypothetical protein
MDPDPGAPKHLHLVNEYRLFLDTDPMPDLQPSHKASQPWISD